MPGSNVNWPVPLTRLNPFYPGQPGVPGTDSETGLRQHVTGATFWVDPNCTYAEDNQDGTNPTWPMETVAAAATKCQPYNGDTIAVMFNGAWPYADPTSGYNLPVSEAITLSVPGVRLVGIAPSSSTGVPWQVPTSGGTAITVTAIDVLIEGFAFLGNAAVGGTAINAEWDDPVVYGENLTVRHCLFDEDIDTAIDLEYSWFCDIHHNRFWECDLYGVYVDPGGSGIAYAAIHHNLFHDIGTGALSMPLADDCHIYENSIYNSVAAGLAGAPTNTMIDLTGGNDNQVHHNTLSCILPAAVAWDYNGCNTAGTDDAWMQNYCMNGPNTTNPT